MAKICLLEDSQVILAPHDPGETPSWVPSLPGDRIFWVNRDIFNTLITRRHDKTCDICPSEIKELYSGEAERSKKK